MAGMKNEEPLTLLAQKPRRLPLVVRAQPGPGFERRPRDPGLGLCARRCEPGHVSPGAVRAPGTGPAGHRAPQSGRLLATCQAGPAGGALLRVVTQQFTVHTEVTSGLVAFGLLWFDFKDVERTWRKPGLAVDVAHHTSWWVTYPRPPRRAPCSTPQFLPS